MELDELKKVWNDQAHKLDRLLSLNLQTLKTTQLDKTRSALDQFRKYLLFELLVGSLLLIASGSYIADHFSRATLWVPASIFAASALVAVIGCVRKLVLLGQIDYTEPVTTIQEKIELVKLSFFRTIRLMILMLPLYMVYIVVGLNLMFGWDILAYGDRAYLWSNLIFSVILIVPSIWMFRKLNTRSTDNALVRRLVHGSGGHQMMAALEFLKTLHEFEDEN
jgi:hypothetical protein